MAEILVSDLCDLSPAVAVGGFCCCREECGPLVHCSWICFRLFFSLFFIVSRQLPFFSRLQRLMLYSCRFSPCKSPVFFWAKILTHFSRVQAIGVHPENETENPTGDARSPYCAASFDAASSARSSSGCGMAMML
jgi:hypothetical protein